MSAPVILRGLGDACPACGLPPSLTECTLWFGSVWHPACAKRLHHSEAKHLADTAQAQAIATDPQLSDVAKAILLGKPVPLSEPGQ